MKPTIIPAPAGYEYIEIMGDTFYRSAVLALAYDPSYGVKPLGMGDTLEDGRHKVGLVLPDGRVQYQGELWPSVEAFLAANAGGQSDAA